MIDDALVLNPHLVTIDNGSIVTSQGIGSVPMSPLNPNFILHISYCPYTLVSLN